MVDSDLPMEMESECSNRIFTKIVDENIRTNDVISDVKLFNDLMISPKICELLNRNQFYTPTPVQAKAIPLLLFGSDMLVQAKAGTGKTLVFGILASKILHETEKTRKPQVLIVAPTREIANQIYEIVRLLIPRTFWAGLFVGGTDLAKDIELLKKGCQIAIGTCGRVSQLAKMKLLNLDEVQLFVLDEADKLMEEDFVKHVNYLFSLMPQEMKQVCVFSAIYPTELEDVLKNFMRLPTLLRLNVDGDQQLIGVKEYCVFCDTVKKADALVILLNKIIFNQCIIFCDSLDFCSDVYNFLIENEFDCASLGSNMPQDQRFQVLKNLKNKKIRILVATDLMARGVDIPGIDLVINLNPSFDMETHMHRVGRAGRYGGKGIAITTLGNTKEAERMCDLMHAKKLDVRTLDVCGEFPFNLIEDHEFHSNSLHFENHPIIAGGEDDVAAEGDMEIEEVPVRARTRKVFYLHRDFVEIFTGRTAEEWTQYAEENIKYLDYSCITTVTYAHPELRKILYTKPTIQQESKKTVHQQKSVENSSISITPKSGPIDEKNEDQVEKSVEIIIEEKNEDQVEKSVENLIEDSKPIEESIEESTIIEKSPICNEIESTTLSDNMPTQIEEEEIINRLKKSHSIDDVENKNLKPFCAFRSITQFREIYENLDKELAEKKTQAGYKISSHAVMPERFPDDQFESNAKMMIDLRKKVFQKPDNF